MFTSICASGKSTIMSRFYYLKIKVLLFRERALVAQSSGQAPFTSEIVGSNLGSDSLHSCEKS